MAFDRQPLGRRCAAPHRPAPTPARPAAAAPHRPAPAPPPAPQPARHRGQAGAVRPGGVPQPRPAVRLPRDVREGGRAGGARERPFFCFFFFQAQWAGAGCVGCMLDACELARWARRARPRAARGGVAGWRTPRRMPWMAVVWRTGSSGPAPPARPHRLAPGPAPHPPRHPPTHPLRPAPRHPPADQGHRAADAFGQRPHHGRAAAAAAVRQELRGRGGQGAAGHQVRVGRPRLPTGFAAIAA